MDWSKDIKGFRSVLLSLGNVVHSDNGGEFVRLLPHTEGGCQRVSHRGGARGVPGGPLPPHFCLAPQWPPKNFPRDVMPLHWSPTLTIDSSPCCKTGPSSGPPKWKCLAPPLVSQIQYLGCHSPQISSRSSVKLICNCREWCWPH